MSEHQAAPFLHYPAHVPVRFRVCRETEPDPARCDQGTRGGICFPCADPLEPGTLAQVSLATPQGVERFIVRVAWCREADGRDFLAGARLRDAEDACRARLAAQLCHIDAYRRRQRSEGRDLDEDTAASEWIGRYAHEVPDIA